MERLPRSWRESIKEVATDMSPTIEAIVTALFPNAELVTDRFHVMKNLLEDLWAIKSKAKTEIKKRIFDEEKKYVAEHKNAKKSDNLQIKR
jgi:transposase